MTEKMPAWLNPQISVGNILTIVALVVAGGMAWGSLRADQAAQDKRLTAVEAATSQRESRVRALEISASGMAADVRSIQAGISRIESSLEKLAGR